MQGSMWTAYNEIQQAPWHQFYEKLNDLLREAQFDRRVEELCARYFEADHTPGRRSIPPGVYFRMHLIGYFEGIESERGIEWRCADSMSLRAFLGLELMDRVPDRSTLSRMRKRLPLEVHEQAFVLILGIVEQKGLLRGRVHGVDSTFLRANASIKAIVRRDTGESHPQFIKRLAEDSGIEDPTEDDARRFDRSRKRGELLERTFAHVYETGGARRTRLRGRENVSKRSVAGERSEPWTGDAESARVWYPAGLGGVCMPLSACRLVLHPPSGAPCWRQLAARHEPDTHPGTSPRWLTCLVHQGDQTHGRSPGCYERKIREMEWLLGDKKGEIVAGLGRAPLEL